MLRKEKNTTEIDRFAPTEAASPDTLLGDRQLRSHPNNLGCPRRPGVGGEHGFTVIFILLSILLLFS